MPVWIVSGVAASGKSSLARALAGHLGLPCLDADAFHPPANLEKMRSGRPLDEADREVWLAGLEAALRDRRGTDLVLAFPGLRRSHRERVAAAAGDARFIRLDIDLATAEARLRARGGHFPAALAASQFQALEPDPGLAVLDGRQPPAALLEAALAWVRSGPEKDGPH